MMEDRALELNMPTLVIPRRDNFLLVAILPSNSFPCQCAVESHSHPDLEQSVTFVVVFLPKDSKAPHPGDHDLVPWGCLPSFYPCMGVIS